MTKHYKIYGDDLPPPSPEEMEWKPDWEKDAAVEPVTELHRIKQQVAQIPPKTISRAISEESKAIQKEAPSPQIEKKTPKSKAQLNREWRAKNRDHYLAKNREYVARHRAKTKSSQ